MPVSSSRAGASSAKARNAAVAITALLSTGSSSRLRPQSPIMANVSSGPNPSPPCAAGTVMASTPSSASPRHTVRIPAVGRTLDRPKPLEAVLLAEVAFDGVVQLPLFVAEFEVQGMLLLQTDDHLGDDVFLNFVGAAENRQLALIEVRGRQCRGVARPRRLASRDRIASPLPSLHGETAARRVLPRAS